MGRIANFIEQRVSGYSIADLDRDMDFLTFGIPTATGATVSETRALHITAYFDGVRMISETVGQVPLIQYRRVLRGPQPGRYGKQRAVDQALYFLLHDQPNPEMDAMSFKTTMQGHATTWGNAFAEIEWDMDAGEPKALWPLNVSMMKVGRDENTGEIIYVYTLPGHHYPSLANTFRPGKDGTITVVLPAYRVWHMPGFGFDGIIGYDGVFLMRESLGLSMALEEHAARFFGNGARPGGILTHPSQLTPEAKGRMRDSWNEAYGGLQRGHRVAILDEGITYKDIGIPPDNAQFLESRKFQVVEVARMLNIPPHKLKDLDRATFSNIEHQDLEFLKYSIGPWFRRWEQTCNRKMILPGDRMTYFCEFLEDALLRADSKTRSAFYKELFYLAALSPNDIREKENMNPIDDSNGDRYFVQQNMAPLDMVEQMVAAQAREALAPKQLRIGNLNDAIRTVATREKERILRAAKRDPGGFNGWLADFYRDFPEYIERQLEPLLGSDTDQFIAEYIQRSKEALDGIDINDIEKTLEYWEDRTE